MEWLVNFINKHNTQQYEMSVPVTQIIETHKFSDKERFEYMAKQSQPPTNNRKKRKRANYPTANSLRQKIAKKTQENEIAGLQKVDESTPNHENLITAIEQLAENEVSDVTAAYTITTVDNKQIRTLVDSGANRSYVSTHLVQYLKYQIKVAIK